jgi:hypothetical protein
VPGGPAEIVRVGSIVRCESPTFPRDCTSETYVEQNPKAVIIAALAGRHAGDEVALTLVRLAVTGQVVETGGKYSLAVAPGP